MFYSVARGSTHSARFSWTHLRDHNLRTLVLAAVLGVGVVPAQADWFALADESIAEFTLNQTLTDDQCHASVAMDSLGNATIPWESVVSGSGRDNIFAIVDEGGVLFDFDGVPGAPFDNEESVATSTADDQRHPDVVTSREPTANDDDSIIVWSSGSDTAHEFDTYVRVFDAEDGTPGPNADHKANDGIKSARRTWPDVAVVRCGGDYPACVTGEAGNGEFVVVWARSIGGTIPPTAKVMARAYTDTGLPITDPLQLGDTFDLSTTPPHQVLPDVAVDHEGNAIAVWVDLDETADPIETTLRYCEFDLFETSPAGCTGSETVVIDPNNSGEGQVRPSVDLTSNGDLLFAWTEWPAGNQVESKSSSWFKRYSGALIDGPFHVDWDAATPALGHHRVVARFVDDNLDHILLAWTFDNNGSDGDILGREVCMDSNGDPTGPAEVTLNSTTTGDQLRPSIDFGTVDGGDVRVWVTWESLDDGVSTTGLDIRGRAWDPQSSACTSP